MPSYEIKLSEHWTYLPLQHHPSAVLLYLQHVTAEAETRFLWRRKAQERQAKQAEEGGRRGSGALTEVMNLYKGCLLSVYFTVMGLRSYRNQIAGMMRPVWL